jgi:uncharacterized membrane protein
VCADATLNGMSTNAPDAERVARLAAELAELGRRMAWARYELLSLSVAAPAAAPHPPSAPQPSVTQPSVPLIRERRSGGQLLPWAGGAITLVGVVMFLALAASRGWFGVPPRLIAGAALGLALVGIGQRVHRRAEASAGALALAGTGIAALYLVVVTATARYHYLPDAAGLLLGLVVAGGGLALADRWRSQPLACAAVLGVGLMMPVLTDGSMPLLVWLALVPQLAAAPVWIRREWTWLAVVAAIFPVLYGSAAVFAVMLSESLSGSPERRPTVLAVAAVFLVGLVLALYGPSGSRSVTVAARLVAASAPVLAMATVYGGWSGAGLAGAVGLAALLAALAPAAGTPLDKFVRPDRLTRIASATVAGVAIFEATALALGGAALTGVLLSQALALVVLAASAGRRGPLLAGICYGLVGLGLAVFRDAPARALAEFPAQPYLSLGQPDPRALLTGLTLSVLVVLLAATVVVAGARTGPPGAGSPTWLWVPAGVVGLYGAAGVVITAALLVVPAQPGFLGGHAIITISWTLAALVLMGRGVDRAAPRLAGLVLIASAVAKLVLFDLVALDGLARVAAFVGAGLLMLAAGTRYARLVARSQQ